MSKSKHGTASQVPGWFVEFQLAALRALPRDISQKIADEWRNNGEGLAKTFRNVLIPPPAESRPEPKPELLLDLVGTVKIPATSGQFIACDKFVRNTSRKAKVKISYIEGNFTELFFDKIEEATAETELRYAKLIKSSLDETIRAEIGAQFEETTLAHMYALMERQANGKSGTLLTNGYANIFYIHDIYGALRAVSCAWVDDGWRLSAYSVEDPRGWHDVSQVFYRDSSVAQDK